LKSSWSGHLLTLRGPSPGAPPPPRMQVPTHLVVHCSALADLGCLIRSAFPSPPAQLSSAQDALVSE